MLQKSGNDLLVVRDLSSGDRRCVPFNFHNDWDFLCCCMVPQEALVLFDSS
jgi:hypothetical protein